MYHRTNSFDMHNSVNSPQGGEFVGELLEERMRWCTRLSSVHLEPNSDSLDVPPAYDSGLPSCSYNMNVHSQSLRTHMSCS